jgi:hypothetical protein
VRWNRLIIYSFIVVYLAYFVIWFVVDWGSLWYTLAIFQAISIIMLYWQGGSKAMRSFLHLIWITCVGYLTRAK